MWIKVELKGKRSERKKKKILKINWKIREKGIKRRIGKIWRDDKEVKEGGNKLVVVDKRVGGRIGGGYGLNIEEVIKWERKNMRMSEMVGYWIENEIRILMRKKLSN